MTVKVHLFLVLHPGLSYRVEDMKASEDKRYRILGQRTTSHSNWQDSRKYVRDKVLNDERSTAYASHINDINTWWLDCKDCNWYKSRETVTSEERLEISLLHFHWSKTVKALL